MDFVSEDLALLTPAGLKVVLRLGITKVSEQLSETMAVLNKVTRKQTATNTVAVTRKMAVSVTRKIVAKELKGEKS